MLLQLEQSEKLHAQLELARDTEHALRETNKGLTESLRVSEGEAGKLSRQLSESEREFMRMAERVSMRAYLCLTCG